jgi:hypothetical protein
MAMSKSSTKKHPVRRAISKKINRKELEAFSKGQDYLDMMEEESNEHNTKMVSLLMQGKKTAKREVLQTGSKTSPKKTDNQKTALILLFATDLNGDRELFPREKLFQLLEGLSVLNVKIVVIDTQQPADLNNLAELPAHTAGQIVWYNPRQDNSGQGREEKEIDRLLLAADLAILFNHHTELVQLLKNYGVVMVADESCPLLENYRPNEETGNAFLFNQKDLWSVFAAIVRSLETYRFPYDWQHIVRNLQK